MDVDDSTADRAEVDLMRRDGNSVLAMLPLVAKGQSIGLVELISNAPISFDDEHLGLARTMANEAAMALENARLYEDARALADRDPLTGFYNHRFLHERLGEEVVRAQRARRPLSVLMLDLDDFKLVNDTFGHLFGDRVLTWTAELIRSTLRDLGRRRPATAATSSRSSCPRPTATRHGASPNGSSRRSATTPIVGEQRGPVPIGASIGVATFPGDGRTATELIAAADAALYRVKRDGGHDAAARARRLTRCRPDGHEQYPAVAPRSTGWRMDASADWCRPSSIPDVSRSTEPTRATRRDAGSSDPTSLVDLRRVVLRPRPDRRAPAR